MKTTNMKATIRIFRRGNSIAVRIPHGFKPEAGKTIEINRRRKAIVLLEPDESMAVSSDGFVTLAALLHAGKKYEKCHVSRYH